MRVVEALPAGSHDLDQIPPRLELHTQLAEVLEEAVRGICDLKQPSRLLNGSVHATHGDGHEERLLGWEVPVQGARSDSRAASDLIDGNTHAVSGEDFVRCLQQSLAVAPGVGAEGPGPLLDNRSVRSVCSIRSHRSDCT